MKPIPEIISDVVAAVRSEYDTVGGEKPYFMHGHPREIVQILSRKTSSSEWKYKKYPLIVLFQDFDEQINGDIRTASLNIVICTNTKNDFEASERYEETFLTTLYPIFDLFMKHFKKSKYLNTLPANITYTKTDRLYWGRTGLYGNDGNIFNDFIDAIEIQNLSASYLLNCNTLN